MLLKQNFYFKNKYGKNHSFLEHSFPYDVTYYQNVVILLCSKNSSTPYWKSIHNDNCN